MGKRGRARKIQEERKVKGVEWGRGRRLGKERRSRQGEVKENA